MIDGCDNRNGNDRKKMDVLDKAFYLFDKFLFYLSKSGVQLVAKLLNFIEGSPAMLL